MITKELAEELADLIIYRKEARKRKDWNESDRLREEIRKLGYLIIDTKDDIGWKLKKI